MKYYENRKNIEEFIAYKADNAAQSEQTGRIYHLKKKYQRLLDQSFTMLRKKQLEWDNFQRESKNMNRGVWNQLLEISSAIKRVESEHYKYVDLMRKIKQQAQEKSRKRNEEERKIRAHELELRQSIEQIKQSSQFYYFEKQNSIDELIISSLQMRRKIDNYTPIVQTYLQRVKAKEEIAARIFEIRKQNQENVKNLWESVENLESLKKSMKMVLQKKQEQEREEALRKKSQINKIMKEINQRLSALSSQQQKQQKLQEEKNFILKLKQQYQRPYEELKQGEPEVRSERVRSEGRTELKKDDKFRRVESIMSKDLTILDEGIEKRVSESVLQLDEQLRQLQVSENEATGKQEELRTMEQLKEKEIQSLNETLRKITISLS